MDMHSLRRLSNSVNDIVPERLHWRAEPDGMEIIIWGFNVPCEHVSEFVSSILNTLYWVECALWITLYCISCRLVLLAIVKKFLQTGSRI